jgi:hypothetical protein
MVFPIVGGDGKPTGYEIENSLRFEDGDSPELTFTPSSAGTQTKFTISLWFKLGNITSTRRVLFGAGDDYLRLADDDNIQWHVTDNGGTGRSFYTSAKIRDPSAWYHVVALWDTTQGTDTNRMRLWTNGVEQTANSFTRPSQNATSQTLNSAAAHKLGGELNPGNDFHFDGYISEFYFIDGYAYDYQDFGEFDDNGVWIPKDFTGSYGSNGIRLEFKQTGTSANSSGIGADTSGNDNHMSVTNLAATDVTEDTPTNNFATWNPLHKASNVTLTEGNCKAAIAGAGQSRSTTATIAVSKGKWYFEIKYTSDNVSGFIGLVSADIGWNINDTSYPSSSVSDNVGFNDGGTKYVNGSSSSYGSGFGNNDIIGVAANLDDGEVVFYVNGTAENSGTAISKTFSGDNFFVVQHQSSNGTSNFEVNFGNPTFSISSGNADANGYGNFEYAVPSGFYSLCTKNLAEYG